jgi:hypothetical protein
MKFNVGDTVRVKPSSRSRYDTHTDDGYPGRVTNVARKYATAEYAITYDRPNGPYTRTRTIDFDMSTGRERGNDNYPVYVYTPDDLDRRNRRNAAIQALKDHHIDIAMGYSGRFTLERLEDLAGVVKAWTD